MRIATRLLSDGKLLSEGRFTSARQIGAPAFPSFAVDDLSQGDGEAVVGKISLSEAGMAAPALALLTAAKRGDL